MFDRQMWQCRVLEYTHERPIGMVVLSVLSHNYDEVLPVFLRTVFGCVDVNPPAIVSAAKISKDGAIVADFMDEYGSTLKNAVIANSELELRNAFRTLADRLKLSDADRTEMFKCVQRWVVADTRLDPNMDPKDPDARRLH